MDSGTRMLKQPGNHSFSPSCPKPPCNIIELGSGTGSLSILLAEQGHQVTGVDVSKKMVDLAKAKAGAAGLDIKLFTTTPPPPTSETALSVLCWPGTSCGSLMIQILSYGDGLLYSARAECSFLSKGGGQPEQASHRTSV